MAWILSSTLLMAFAGLLAYIFFQRKGHFENEEDVKYQMFRSEHQEKQDE